MLCIHIGRFFLDAMRIAEAEEKEEETKWDSRRREKTTWCRVVVGQLKLLRL